MIVPAVLIGVGFGVLVIGFIVAIVTSTKPDEPVERIDPHAWLRDWDRRRDD